MEGSGIFVLIEILEEYKEEKVRGMECGKNGERERWGGGREGGRQGGERGGGELITTTNQPHPFID